MNKAIGDTAAINFATAFYEALGAGKAYEKCFEFARGSLNLEGIPESETPKIRYRPRRNNYDIQETKTAENTDNLPSPPVSQTMTISGGTVKGQVGQAGRDLTQTQNFSSDDQEKQLTITEVRTLIQKIEAIFRSSNLPEKYQEKALNYLESVQEEIQASEPDKSYAAKSLQKANKALKDANIWDKLKPQLEPLLTQLESWLEVEAKTLSNF